MSNVLSIDLFNRQQAWAAIKRDVFPFLARWLQDGRRLVLTIKPRPRSVPQNKRYWGNGVLSQIAAQATVGGKLYPAEIWHEMLKRECLGVEELPNGQVVGKSTKGLTTTEFSEFCTRVEAYAASELNVIFYDLEEQ